MNKAKDLDHYKDNNSTKEIIKSIAEVIDYELLKSIKEADFFRILLNESKDESGMKQTIIVLRFAVDLNIDENIFV